MGGGDDAIDGRGFMKAPNAELLKARVLPQQKQWSN